MPGRVLRAGLSVLLAASGSIALAVTTPGIAQATPTGCYQQVIRDHTGAYSRCNGGTGRQQVGAVCSYLYFPTNYVTYGPLQQPAVPSLAFCGWGYRVTDVWTVTEG
jgi:hypothetical protein